ncbi:cytochrome c biogenesis protein CcdA [Paenibacillus qinlingensis]|uniref:Cytochrome c-type biogenesis protein n=1 Tax=Paenibacillus qinlingensis TaxID=1837343 RepID=A0ABU1P410_9BACL|nr:cytochrome c biogenesis protein CcdA [Paenibacillus qinlingensis]MDR6554438.1 cytochrome c-type biogenesis protein [Paenibacillus qinlingensis]
MDFILAFSAGLLSFISPCVLPLIPVYFSYIVGSSIPDMVTNKGKSHVVYKSLFFILGFSLEFIGLGISVSSISKLFTSNLSIFRQIGGVVIILFGLHMTGIFKIKWLYSEKRFLTSGPSVKRTGPFLVGMAFAVGWTPCIGPMLSTILIYAGSMETIQKGVLLLTAYSLGMAMPFVLSAFLVEHLSRLLKKVFKYLPIFSVISGIIMIFMGVLVFTNRMETINQSLSFLTSSYSISEEAVVQTSNLQTVDANTESAEGATAPNTLLLDAQERENAIDFTVTDLHGQRVTLSDLKGKNVYINFWATWCKWCIKEMPDMEKVYHDYKDDNIVMLAIDVGESHEKVSDYLKEHPYSFRVLLDPDKKVTQAYKLRSIPVSIFVDKQGRVAYNRVGTLTEDQMRTVIKGLLAE